jgi:hypothetical protein
MKRQLRSIAVSSASSVMAADEQRLLNGPVKAPEKAKSVTSCALHAFVLIDL